VALVIVVIDLPGAFAFERLIDPSLDEVALEQLLDELSAKVGDGVKG